MFGLATAERRAAWGAIRDCGDLLRSPRFKTIAGGGMIHCGSVSGLSFGAMMEDAVGYTVLPMDMACAIVATLIKTDDQATCP